MRNSNTHKFQVNVLLLSCSYVSTTLLVNILLECIRALEEINNCHDLKSVHQHLQYAFRLCFEKHLVISDNFLIAFMHTEKGLYFAPLPKSLRLKKQSFVRT